MNEEQVRYEANARGLRLTKIAEYRTAYTKGYRWQASDGKSKVGIFGTNMVAGDLDSLYCLFKDMPIVITGYTSKTKTLKVTKIRAVLYSTPMHGFQGTVLVHRHNISGDKSEIYGMEQHLTRATVNRLFGLIKVAKSFKVYPNHGEGVICLEIEA